MGWKMFYCIQKIICARNIKLVFRHLLTCILTNTLALSYNLCSANLNLLSFVVYIWGKEEINPNKNDGILNNWRFEKCESRSEGVSDKVTYSVLTCNYIGLLHGGGGHQFIMVTLAQIIYHSSSH